MEKKTLLLSACCGPCATVSWERLSENYNVTLLFWGSNIHPVQEYEKRLESIIALCNNTSKFSETTTQNAHPTNAPIIIAYAPIQPETCEQCFELRLRETAAYAKDNNFDYFATSLTTSPHKPAETINRIGKRLESEYNIKYLPTDFKKNNGFVRSVKLSKQLNLYRQNYCGCARSLTALKYKKV